MKSLTRILTLYGCLSAPVIAFGALDALLVLDNSGSMRGNDPTFRTNSVIRQFVEDMSGDVRLGMVIFDQGVRYAVPLAPLNDATRTAIDNALESMDYRGQWTDSPAAVERAIRELVAGGRPNAGRAIVFMTDGIVDIGNDDALDAERARVLREELSLEAALNNVQIFGVAFTANADLALIRELAEVTNGASFRAPTVADLEGVFGDIEFALASLSEEAASLAARPELPDEFTTESLSAEERRLLEESGISVDELNEITSQEFATPAEIARGAGAADELTLESLSEEERRLLADAGIPLDELRVVEPEAATLQPSGAAPADARADEVPVEALSEAERQLFAEAGIPLDEAGAGQTPGNAAGQGGPMAQRDTTIGIRGTGAAAVEPGSLSDEERRLLAESGVDVDSLNEVPAGGAIVIPPAQSGGVSMGLLVALMVGSAVGVGLVIFGLLTLAKRKERQAGAPAAAKTAAKAEKPEAYLFDIDNVGGKRAIPLDPERPVMIGRVKGADQHLDYIVLGRPTIGRRHAIIKFKDFDYWIMDQGSVNGTFVNGARIVGERPLKHKDVIKLHKYDFRFEIPSQADKKDQAYEAADATMMADAGATMAAQASDLQSSDAHLEDDLHPPTSSGMSEGTAMQEFFARANQAGEQADLDTTSEGSMDTGAGDVPPLPPDFEDDDSTPPPRDAGFDMDASDFFGDAAPQPHKRAAQPASPAPAADDDVFFGAEAAKPAPAAGRKDSLAETAFGPAEPFSDTDEGFMAEEDAVDIQFPEDDASADDFFTPAPGTAAGDSNIERAMNKSAGKASPDAQADDWFDDDSGTGDGKDRS